VIKGVTPGFGHYAFEGPRVNGLEGTLIFPGDENFARFEVSPPRTLCGVHARSNSHTAFFGDQPSFLCTRAAVLGGVSKDNRISPAL